MRSQDHSAREIVLGQRRTGGEGSLPCASVTVPFTAQHPLPLRQLLLRSVSQEQRWRGHQGCHLLHVCPLILAKGCAYLYTCPQVHLQTASVDMEGQSDVALTQQDFTSSCSL